MTLIDVQNFDITRENLALLDRYTYEDIQLVEHLVKAKQYDNLARLYDGAGTCVNFTLNQINQYGKYIQFRKIRTFLSHSLGLFFHFLIFFNDCLPFTAFTGLEKKYSPYF